MSITTPIKTPINSSFATASFPIDRADKDSSVIYTDAHGLTDLKAQARNDQDKALPEVARQFESVFIGMILKGMRQVSLGDDLMGSEAVDSFKDMHDQQMSIELAKGEGFGFAKSIVEQLRRDKQNTFDPDINPDGTLTLPIRRNFYSQMLANKEKSTEGNVESITQTKAAETESAVVDNSIKKEGGNKLPENTFNFASTKEFVDKLWPMAEKSAKALGVNPEVLISQAALETGWGQSIIKNGKLDSHNLFNIKADSHWHGEKVSKLSLEYANDKAINKKSFFRAYDSLQDSFDDYVKFIKNNPRYEKAIKQVGNSEQYLHGIHKAGYATDPNYVEKIMKVMNSSDIKNKLSKST